MARLMLQLGGSLVIPIDTPRRFPSDWRMQSFTEAGLAETARPGTWRDNAQDTIVFQASGAAGRVHGHTKGACR